MKATSLIPYYGAYKDWGNVIELYDSGQISFGEAVAESVMIGAIQGITFGVSVATVPTIGTVRMARALTTVGPTAALTLSVYAAGEILLERDVSRYSIQVSPGESVQQVTPMMSSGFLGWLENIF